MQLINILIRTGHRPSLFTRCLKSITDQNYPRIRVIVSIDRECDYVPDWCEVVGVEKNALEFGYDLYINTLKDMVNEGWFLILDDDDILAPNILNQIDFDAPALLVQINHMGRILPQSETFGLGQVGFPCLVLHHTLKNMAMTTGLDHGDYHYTIRVQSQIELKFVPLVLVICDRKSNGT